MSMKYKGNDGYLNTASPDPYVSLAAAVVYSGVVSGDFDFLESEWCGFLLHEIGCRLSGLELLDGYVQRREREWQAEQQKRAQS